MNIYNDSVRKHVTELTKSYAASIHWNAIEVVLIEELCEMILTNWRVMARWYISNVQYSTKTSWKYYALYHENITDIEMNFQNLFIKMR